MSQPVFDGARQRLRGVEIEREIRWRSYRQYRLKGILERRKSEVVRTSPWFGKPL